MRINTRKTLDDLIAKAVAWHAENRRLVFAHLAVKTRPEYDAAIAAQQKHDQAGEVLARKMLWALEDEAK